MSSFLNYMGMGGSPPKNENKNKDSAVRALPGEWYTSQEMYELERRAIFSRKWMLITHKTRLQKTGDYLKFNVAEYEFILTRDRNDNINGFHNVCRHRAFPVVTEKEGTAKIFSCKYHGWSYGLNGKLAKAPGYQELTGFDKESNGLLPIHVRVDKNNFIWVNLDAKQTPELSWEEEFDNIDAQERYNLYNFDDYEFDHFWEMDGAYNWKILADNYNAKEVRKGIDTLRRRIEKHFGDVEGESANISRNLVGFVCQEAQKYYEGTLERAERVMGAIYPNTEGEKNVEIDFGREDIRSGFRR